MVIGLARVVRPGESRAGRGVGRGGIGAIQPYWAAISALNEFSEAFRALMRA